MTLRPFVTAALAVSMSLGVAGAEPIDVSPVDCVSPAPDAEPGSTEFRERDMINMYCSEERKIDQATHPVFALPAPVPTAGWRLSDAYRAPDRHNGSRFRFEPLTIGGIATEVYRPCSEGSCPNLTEGVATFEPPYPTVVIIHGVLSRKELHWWASQTLAESGYMVIAIDSTSNATTMLDWLHADSPHPLVADADLDRVGLAGHSAGAGAVAGRQGDPRASAIVVWDGGTSVSQEPDHVTPTMYQMADYTTWPGYPVPYNSVAGTVRASGFSTLRDKGVDSMVITGRATTHIEWTGGAIWGNRLAEAMLVYYNIAWFDRFLKGKLVLTGTESAEEEVSERALRQAIAQDAYNRLTADTFDDSVDKINISQGLWNPVKAAVSGDPLYGGNVPYSVAGRPIADRLSFYYRSVCSVSVPDYVNGSDGSAGAPVAARSENIDDMRTGGCPEVE